MINYIINFIICSGMLLLVYRAFLGAENLYRFNRFYLLFSLVFSLAVPATTIHVPYVSMPAWDKLIANIPAAVVADKPLPHPIATERMQMVIDEPVQPQTAAPAIMGVSGNADNYTITPTIPQAAISTPARREAAPKPQTTHNYLPEILLALYAVVTLILLFRFMRNSYHITRVVAGSTIIDYQDTKLVLVADDVTPHSFLKYVFLNKAAYYNKTIEPEIICHEQTHVRQLHSLDVIGIELLQIVCWFNFFIPLYRKAIQLNHEFLADEAVIESYQDTPAYQHLLLAKASQSGSLYLTSQFNYLVTKKRIIMMTKRTTAAIALYKQLALLPVLAVAIFLFSQKSLAQVAKKTQPVNKPQTAAKKAEHKAKSTAVEAAAQDAPQSVLDEYAKILAKYGIPYKKGVKINYTSEFSAVDKERVTILYKQMSHKQQQHQYIRLAHVPPPPRMKFSEKDFKQWQTNVGYMVYIDDKQIKNADLARYKISDFPNVLLSQMPVPSAKSGWHWKVNLMTPAYYNEYLRKGDKLHLIYIPKEKWKYTDWPIGGVVLVNKQAQVMPAAQHDAPPSVLAEYAKIEKKYSEYNPNFTATSHSKNPYVKTWTITARDKARMITLYKQMSARQQAKQEVRFYPREPFMTKINPTAGDFNTWKDGRKYTVRVNYKIIKNKDLDKYSPADFDHYAVVPYSSFGLKRDRKEVSLITRTEYANAYKKYKADTSRYNFGVVFIPPPVLMPLIVVDGVPFKNPLHKQLYAFDFKTTSNVNYGRLLGIDPSDILSISVLKGEAAKDAWGNRGGNGVIIINTKNGVDAPAKANEQSAKVTRNIDSNADPLVIVDGKVTDRKVPPGFDFATADNTKYADWLAVTPNDISTISILKDGAAVAQWGEKAANGVLMITTKHAKK